MEDNTKYNQIVDRINALDEVIKRNKKEQEFDNIKPEYEYFLFHFLLWISNHYRMNDIARGYFNPSIDDNFSHDPMFNDSYDHLKFGNNYFYNSEFVKRPLDDPSRIHESVHRVPNASMYRNSKNIRKDSKLELKRESKLQSKINSTLYVVFKYLSTFSLLIHSIYNLIIFLYLKAIKSDA